jgi:hypothetical protein
VAKIPLATQADTPIHITDFDRDPRFEDRDRADEKSDRAGRPATS